MKDFLTGANGVAEAIRRGRGVLHVSRTAGRAASLVELAGEHGITVRRVSEDDLRRMVHGGDHRGFALEIDSAPPAEGVSCLEDLQSSGTDESLVIVLDGITDPQNLGSVLRAADQFGADAVVIPKRRSAQGDADSMSRASAGAVEWIPLLEVVNLSRAFKSLKEMGYWIWGADLEGKIAPEVNLKGRTAIVMGREGEGLHRLIREDCDGLIQITTGGRLDSLNVGVAAGILLYETRRQQNFSFITGSGRQ